jgi:UPF0755 protein
MDHTTEQQNSLSSKDFFQSGPLFARYKKHLVVGLAVIALLFIFFRTMSAPRDFPSPTIITIPYGTSLTSISALLADDHIIRSPFVFQSFAILFSGDRTIAAGDFAFESSEPVYQVAWRIAHSQYGIARKRVTIPEGSTVRDIAGIVSKQLINFDSEGFIALAEPKEGYLFPDTYFFFTNAKPETVVSVMEDNFTTRTEPLAGEIAASKHSFADIVTMASVIEREANKPDDRRVVAGILWKRLAAGMRLQVDAPFFYLRQGIGGDDVTVSDLESDSPYNTYTHAGLTPAPIGNPGLDSIIAALEPTTSAYWYYLYDPAGTIHYAATFDQHKTNKAKYLK